MNESLYLLGSRDGRIMILNEEGFETIYQLDRTEILKSIDYCKNGLHLMKSNKNDYVIDIHQRKCCLLKIKNEKLSDTVTDHQFLVNNAELIC